jgi:hypothetical protein
MLASIFAGSTAGALMASSTQWLYGRASAGVAHAGPITLEYTSDTMKSCAGAIIHRAGGLAGGLGEQCQSVRFWTHPLVKHRDGDHDIRHLQAVNGARVLSIRPVCIAVTC